MTKEVGPIFDIKNPAGFIANIARKIHAGVSKIEFNRAELFLDDLIQTGWVGMLQAQKNYDPNRGVKFSTYATPRIRGAILDALKREGLTPMRTIGDILE